MSQEIERLNGALKQKVEEITLLQKEINELKRGNSDSGLKITQITQEYASKISTYETRINQYNLEIEELNRNMLEFARVKR